MTKLVAGVVFLAFGYFLGNGWTDAGGIVLDKVQQTIEAKE